MAIEVINRSCAPCSEFALAEHWYANTALADLLGVPDNAVTKDRLYRTLDALLQAQQAIEDDLQKQFATLFDLDYDLLLYDLTSTYFEGLAEDNDLAQRGYSRDHRSDCKQVVVALVADAGRLPLGPLHPGRQHPGRPDRQATRLGRREAFRPIAARLGDGSRHDQ